MYCLCFYASDDVLQEWFLMDGRLALPEYIIEFDVSPELGKVRASGAVLQVFEPLRSFLFLPPNHVHYEGG